MPQSSCDPSPIGKNKRLLRLGSRERTCHLLRLAICVYWTGATRSRSTGRRLEVRGGAGHKPSSASSASRLLRVSRSRATSTKSYQVWDHAGCILLDSSFSTILPGVRHNDFDLCPSTSLIAFIASESNPHPGPRLIIAKAHCPLLVGDRI